MVRKLFIAALIITCICFFAAIHQMWKLLTGIPIYTDYVFIGIGIVLPMILLAISNKHWRLGLIFVIAYSIARYSSAMISGHSLVTAISLNLLSVLFLIPALLCFLKLRNKKSG